MSVIKRQLPKRPERRAGFTLVEVLIALIIMSVGMLGIAGLYVHSMNAGRTSVFRHHAVTLAGDVGDRIRANPGGGITYEVTAPPGINNNCVAGGVDCDATQMAQHDVFLWSRQATGTLPNGSVAVVYTENLVSSMDSYQITVNWSEAGQIPAPSYAITVQVNDFTGP